MAGPGGLVAPNWAGLSRSDTALSGDSSLGIGEPGLAQVVGAQLPGCLGEKH